MNTKKQLGLLLAAFGLVAKISAQGNLTPPGAPAPTMKSLDQVEPRIIVNAANTPGTEGALYTISQPGSYYLTGNITGGAPDTGIYITANNVILNLEGFALEAGADGQYAIVVGDSLTNVIVENGAISDWSEGGVFDIGGTCNLSLEELAITGSFYGINSASSNVVVRGCSAVDNFIEGINCTGSGVISGCTATANSGGGILLNGGTVINCAADNNADDGFDTQDCNISGCEAGANSGYGILALGSAVSGCEVDGNGTGIFANSSTLSACNVLYNETGITSLLSSVSGCNVIVPHYSYGVGISVVSAGSSVIGNTCNTSFKGFAMASAGINISGETNRIEGNHVSGSFAVGIIVPASYYSGNIIIKNSASTSGGLNYVVPAGNDLGPVGTAATSTSPWANLSN